MGYASRLFFIIGLGCVLMGGHQCSLLIKGTAQPEVVTLAELGLPSGTSNVHLTITEFKFGHHLITFSKKGDWGRVWIPLLTQDNKWTQRPVVVHSMKIKDEMQLQAILNRSEISGVVSNGMQSLGSKQQKEFAKWYPNDNLKDAIAIEIDAKMPSRWIAFPLFIVGVILLVAACYFLYVAYLRPKPILDR